MKKKTNNTDYSMPYRTFGLNKIIAPVKAANQPKNDVIKVNTGDIRARGGKS